MFPFFFSHLLFMNLLGLHNHFRLKEPGVGFGGRSFYFIFWNSFTVVGAGIFVFNLGISVSCIYSININARERSQQLRGRD